MNEVVQNALALWGLPDARWSLVAQRENHVYRIDDTGARFAMRLHRPGLRSDAELQSELQWMAAARDGGLQVPRPIPAADGRLMCVIGGQQVDVLSWLSGSPIGETGAGLRVADRVGTFRALGEGMARLHRISDAWTLPKGFTRWSWDVDGLVGETPVWGRFWDNPILDDEARATLLRFRETARDSLQKLGDTLDFGLIHADLVRENVLTDGETLQMIDFDDGGFGYRLFDLATALLKNRQEPDYPALQAGLIEGYRSVRPIDTGPLGLFLALRAATYVGWIVPRLDEDGADVRNRRMIRDALAMIEAFEASCLPHGLECE